MRGFLTRSNHHLERCSVDHLFFPVVCTKQVKRSIFQPEVPPNRYRWNNIRGSAKQTSIWGTDAPTGKAEAAAPSNEEKNVSRIAADAGKLCIINAASAGNNGQVYTVNFSHILLKVHNADHQTHTSKAKKCCCSQDQIRIRARLNSELIQAFAHCSCRHKHCSKTEVSGSNQQRKSSWKFCSLTV